MIILIEYRGREEKRPSTIDFSNYYILCGGLYQNGENHHFI